MFFRLLSSLVCGLALLSTAWAQQNTSQVALVLNGKAVSGLPLAWGSGGALVLNRDGRLWQFEPSDAEKTRAFEAEFRPATVADMKAQLYREFGQRFRISSTSHYLVVHPSRSKNWPNILESLHRSFLSFCARRKITVRKGRFPMVAIVFPDRGSFMRYAESDLGVPSNALGYYSRLTNRVALYDHGNQSGGVSSTIRHEAAHQSAFNSGVHLRVGETPKWIVEGLGTMFEAEGFYNPSGSRSSKDRAARMYLETVLRTYRNSSAMLSRVENLIAEDRMFQHSQEQAYAVSWAIAFYLADRRPDVFRKVVDHYTRREPFVNYRSDQRVREFVQLTGMPLHLFTSNVFQFVSSMK